jgi:ferric-dicitrate binding protein FerR (iron transport regulator)
MDGGAAFFLFLAVGAASLFSFIAVAAWAGARQAERETYYRTELIKKAMESPTPAALDYLRDRDREAAERRARKTRSGLRLGGLVAVAAGVGLMVFLNGITTYKTGDERNAYLLGLIPVLVGATLFVYSFFNSKE